MRVTCVAGMPDIERLNRKLEAQRSSLSDLCQLYRASSVLPRLEEAIRCHEVRHRAQHSGSTGSIQGQQPTHQWLAVGQHLAFFGHMSPQCSTRLFICVVSSWCYAATFHQGPYTTQPTASIMRLTELRPDVCFACLCVSPGSCC